RVLRWVLVRTAPRSLPGRLRQRTLRKMTVTGPRGAHQRECVAVELELPAPGPLAAAATVSVAEVGRLLRCNEATVRRLIRTTVVRSVGGWEHLVRARDIE